MRRAAKQHGSNLLAQNDPSAAWKYLREATFTARGPSSTFVDLPTLNEHMAKTVQSTSTEDLILPHQCELTDPFRMTTLSSYKMYCLLHTQRTNTATGPDGISASLLKKLAPAITPNVTLILNRCIEESSFPSNWKQANVCAIWQCKGSKSETENYRPISILPVLGRLFLCCQETG